MADHEYIDFGLAIDAIGNNPAKMATMLVVAGAYPDTIGKTQLAKEFDAMQGDEPGWVIGRQNRSIPFSYCKQSLSPILLDASRVNALRGSGTVMGYRLNERGLNEGVPLSGAGLGWELDYPATSTLVLLGSSQTRSRSDKMPSLRIRLCEKLLASPTGKSKAQLQQDLGETVGRMMQLVPNMRDAGIISARERFNPSHRRIIVDNPDFTRLRRAGPRVTDEVVAIYSIAKSLFNDECTDMSGQELLNAISAQYPRLDIKKVWHRILVAGHERLHFLSVEPFVGDDKQHTNYVIAPDYEKPVKALVESYRRLETDASYRNDMAQQADDIVNDDNVMAELMDKAKTFSRYISGNAIESLPTDDNQNTWWQTVVTKIPEGGTDMRSLYEAAFTRGRAITFAHFRNLLKQHDGHGYQLIWAPGRGKYRRRIDWIAR